MCHCCLFPISESLFKCDRMLTDTAEFENQSTGCLLFHSSFILKCSSHTSFIKLTFPQLLLLCVNHRTLDLLGLLFKQQRKSESR